MRRPTTAKDIDQAVARLRSAFLSVRQLIIRSLPPGLARNAALAQLDAALDATIEGLRGKMEPADA